jgi:hypothetical protein
MGRLLLDINFVAVLFVVIGVTLVFASYQDGYPDVASDYNGDWPPTWANYAEVKAWYSAPLRYNQEYHRAYCWGSWGKTVLTSNITFWAQDGSQTAYQENWYEVDSQDKNKTYNSLATAATTISDTYFLDTLTGYRWRDFAIVTVIAGAEPE